MTDRDHADRPLDIQVPGATQAPVSVSWEWVAKNVTTRMYRPAEWTEWQAHFTFRANAPLVTASLLETRGQLEFGGRSPEVTQQETSYRLSMDTWVSGDDGSHRMQVLWGGLRPQFVLPTPRDGQPIRSDARELVSVSLDGECELLTGAAWRLATGAEPALFKAGVVLLDAGDVQVVHGRWRMRSRDPLPSALGWLGFGTQHGRADGLIW